MKIPYKYISNALQSNISINEVSDKLFQLGHEHEIEDDIFEMELTPNRGDCLSLKGLLRDLSVFYELKNFSEEFKERIDNFNFNFINKDPDGCPYITFLKLQISGDIKPYKNYLNNYFKDLKINKNNFFTDISNYLLFETGQPTHCYDSNKLGDQLILENNRNSCNFKTLLGNEIRLEGEDLVFSSKNKIVNLAGVMGGDNTACSDNTRDVIIECAYFNPEKIIGKTIKYDIKSDAAYRFERGVDPLNQETVLRRFIKIVKDHADLDEIKLVEFKKEEFLNIQLDFDVDIINNILGTKISKTKYVNYLEQLGFNCHNNTISVPSFRNDVTHQNDLAEEIARLVGYNNIKSSKLNIKNLITNHKESKEDKLKKVLTDSGFSEVINYPFVEENSHESIKVDNPLDQNKNFLRKNLETSLVNNLLINERRQKDSIKLFEVSDLYTFKDDLKCEKRIGIIASGRVGRNYVDFGNMISEKYFLNIIKPFINKNNYEFKKILRDKLDTKIKTEIFYIEINLSDINDNIFRIDTSSEYPKDYVTYSVISEYPNAVRDISLSLKDYSQLKPLEEKILSIKNKILKDIFVFDFFENVKKEELKIGFRFVFQSKDRTLTDSEVEKVLSDIIRIATSFNGVDIPGL
tara:strand:- start:4494 stop:6398 length:1905 start_codon:yes stop_codon:yes gene_type:complete